MPLADVSDAFIDLLEPIEVETSIAGTRVKGSWVTGGVTLVPDLEAVVQPASNQDINELRIEGDATSSYKKFYSEYQFKTADKLAQTEADLILYKGQKFKVLSIADWDTVGGYNKAMTVRIQ